MTSAWAALRALLATSEFWMVLAQAVVELSSAPIPPEWRGAAWVYIVGRLVSKLAKLIFKEEP